ncbi:MAG: hypothetical protein II516_08340 [Treponema sp.]|nr:hypothetical protein [Treponema sp.]
MSCKGMPPHIRHPELVSVSVEVVAVLLQIPNQVQHDGCMEGWGFDCALEKDLS